VADTTKVETLERIKARVSATLEQNPNGLTAEQNVEVTSLMSEAKKLRVAIAEEDALTAKKKDLEELDQYLNAPKYQVAHGIGDGDGESEERKALAKAGWEVKGGMVHRMTSLGKMIEMWPEDVLFGPIPEDDKIAADFYTKTRASFRPEYRTAYQRYLLMSVKTRSEAMAFNMLSPSEQKALTEGLDTAGGFTVPPDTMAELLVRLAGASVMRRLARIQTTNRDILQWPMVTAAAATAGGLASGGGSVFSSAFVGGWVGEVPAFTETDPVFSQFSIPIRKLRVATKLSNDLVSDSAVNILAFLSSNGAENMALVEDYGFIAGDGGSLQPKGLLNSGAATVDVEGSTSNTISNASGAGTSNKLITMAYTLPSQYAGRASWLTKRVSEGKIRGLNDTGGRPLWPPQTGSGFAAAPADLLGAPVYNSEFMPADGTDANKVIIYGDFSAYVIAQRAQITSTILRERFADTDQVGIILFERVGGDTWNTDAFRIGIV
jgi:HK97 family phage major capsid protein